MFGRPRTQVTVKRPAGAAPDHAGGGGWIQASEQQFNERATVSTPSYRELERAGLEGAEVTVVLRFRIQADIKRQDRVLVSGMEELEVMAIPDDGIPGRKSKAAYCKVADRQHGEN